MKKEQTYPGWFLWLWQKGLFVTSAIALLVLGIVLAAVYYLDYRLVVLEERLTHQPPRQFQMLDLSSYAADDIPIESVAVQKAVYVPIYSHIYHNNGRPLLLEATLSIRNTDVGHALYIRSVRYYDTHGKLVKTYVDRLIRLGPLETVDFLVEQRDASGGSGANFIVDWMATEQIEEPMIEAIMIGVEGTQSIGFRSSGRPLADSNGEQR